MKNFEELIKRVQQHPQKKKVVVVAAHDEHTLEGINRAYENGIVSPILIGDTNQIREIINKEGFSFSDATMIHLTDDVEAAKKAVSMIREGEADFIMKGKIQTADLLKQVVNKETGLRTGGVMSHVGLFEIPGYQKLIVITDGGMIPNPTVPQKALIIQNAVAVLKSLGYETPKVAALAATEVVNQDMQESLDAAVLKKMNQDGRITDCIVEGPISYDLMMSKESADIKGYVSPVTGNTDILLTPDMTTGNLLAKALLFNAGGRMAGIIVGAKAPIVLVSRGATSEEKYLSIVLASAASNIWEKRAKVYTKNTILAINPGSTSTKIALYEEENKVFEQNIEHTSDELAGFDDITDQLDYRYKVIESVLEKEKVSLTDLSAVVGRGGLLPNMSGGGYLVNSAMLEALETGLASPHASNLGALLAHKVSQPLGISAYIYDAVMADEFEEIAKITGMPEVRRQSMCHVLNMKAVSRKVAKKYGKTYEELNLIVAHMGGGISIGVHKGGKIIDAIRDDAGPFSPERAGSLPLLYIVDMCYSGKYNKKQMIKKIRGDGGLKAYLGTSDCRKIEQMIADGSQEAKLLYEALAYQIAKGIGELAPVLKGKVDYIILTGGLAYSKMMVQMLIDRVAFIAPIELAPGEDEMEALSLGTLRIIKGEETAKEYILPKGGQ